jgi:hypothetical protein
LRQFQIAVFAMGVLSFLAAAVFWSDFVGDVCWRVGMALMLGNVVCILLWPSRD